MKELITEIEIDASAETVWAILTDLRHYPFCAAGGASRVIGTFVVKEPKYKDPPGFRRVEYRLETSC